MTTYANELNALATAARDKLATSAIGQGTAHGVINGKQISVRALGKVSNQRVKGNNTRLTWKVNGKVCAENKLTAAIEA